MSKFRFRPSKMALTVACTGSVQLQERYPDETGPDAARGTVAHECLARLLRTGSHIPAGTVMTVDGHSVTVDEDMQLNAAMARDVIAAWGIPVVVEREVACGRIHQSCGGTPDVRGYDPDKKLLRLMDYKYGFGIVEAYENWQLLAYLVGCMDELGVADTDTHVEFTIVQPNASHKDGTVRTWVFKASDVRAQVNTMRNKCEIASGPTATCTPGEHCHAQHCNAAQGCEALHRSTYNTLAHIRKPEAFDLDPQSAARELALLDEAESIIKARRDGLEVRVMADIRNGVVNPHYAIENVNARRRWKEGQEDAVIGVGAMMGVNLVQPRRAITPAQAEKLLGKANAALIKDLSYKPVGEAKLVKFDSAKTRKLFGA